MSDQPTKTVIVRVTVARIATNESEEWEPSDMNVRWAVADRLVGREDDGYEFTAVEITGPTADPQHEPTEGRKR